MYFSTINFINLTLLKPPPSVHMFIDDLPHSDSRYKHRPLGGCWGGGGVIYPEVAGLVYID